MLNIMSDSQMIETFGVRFLMFDYCHILLYPLPWPVPYASNTLALCVRTFRVFIAMISTAIKKYEVSSKIRKSREPQSFLPSSVHFCYNSS
jgi:hypothetical protein